MAGVIGAEVICNVWRKAGRLFHDLDVSALTVADNENAALYHTFTSVNEYQEVNPIRKKIMDLAQTTLGHPYVWGGNDIYHGCDCSGLVQQIYARFGISLPRVAEAQAQVGTKITPASAQPGDLIFFQGTYDTSGASHVGIYVGNGMMIHCGNPISYASIESNYWQQHFYCFGRIRN